MRVENKELQFVQNIFSDMDSEYSVYSDDEGSLYVGFCKNEVCICVVTTKQRLQDLAYGKSSARYLILSEEECFKLAGNSVYTKKTSEIDEKLLPKENLYFQVMGREEGKVFEGLKKLF